MSRESFGIIDKLPSGNYRARYTGPDGKRYSAPHTFKLKEPARLWLSARKLEIASGAWIDPETAAKVASKAAKAAQRLDVTLGAYATKWISTRTNSKGEALRPRTRENYEQLLRAPGTLNAEDKGGLLADLLPLLVTDITPEVVRDWRAPLIERGILTLTARAYGLLKAIMNTAVQDGLVDGNPCQVRGGSHTSSKRSVQPPTDDELVVIVDSIPTKYKALVVIAASGGQRWGEVTALRAKDLTVERDDTGAVSAVRVDVTRGVVKTKDSGRLAAEPKSEAGVRKVAIFGGDAVIIAEHAKELTGDALLFPAADGVGFLPQTTFVRHWYKARLAADRADMPFHALRHYAGTRYAQTGATTKEIMVRLGHSSEKASMRYQHSGNRDDELARRMAR